MFKPLTQSCNITTGKLDSNAALENGKYPFFTCAPEPLSIDTYAFDDDAILLAGNNAQGNFHISRYCGKFNAYQRTYVITAKDGYNIDYIKYSLELSLEHLKKVAQGSQTKFLTMQILDSFLIPDIPYRQQTEMIASIKSIDSKIELNNRIITELEEMAKTIYNYWFVQFDFPDSKGKPYGSSGGKMVWNEKLKREIPKGWSCNNLGEIVKIYNNAFNPSLFENDIVEHYSIPAYDDGKYPIFEPASNIGSGKYCVSKENILVSKLNPHFKRIWDPFCLTDLCACSTEFIPYTSVNKSTRPYCYAVLNSDEFYSFMCQISSSSTGSRKRLKPDDTLRYEFAMPDEKTLERFIKWYKPILSKLKNCLLETHELIKLRDWLLPMLMNGQVAVK